MQDLKINGYASRDDRLGDPCDRSPAGYAGNLPRSTRNCAAAHKESQQSADDSPIEHLLSEILIRNRKKVVGGFMPRQAHRWEVDAHGRGTRGAQRCRGLRTQRLPAAAAQKTRGRGFRHGDFPEADGEQHPGTPHLPRRAARETGTGLSHHRRRPRDGEAAARAQLERLRSSMTTRFVSQLLDRRR